MVKRFMVLACALVFGAAAPARAWCEATCLAPSHASAAKPHCPTHDPAPTGTSMSATQIDDCPVVESARTVTQARLDAHAVAAASLGRQHDCRTASVPSFVRPHGVTSVFERCTPLRI